MEILCAANNDLSNTISLLLNDSRNDSTENENYSFVLNCLIKAATQQNASKGKTGHRHENSMKDFACYIFMLGGRLLYETIYMNLPLPSPTSVGRYLHDNGPEIIEGVMRCSQLKKYLEERNLPMVVWVSEDGTRITGRLQYDPGTNQIVGLLLPLDENGMPKSKSFMATNASAMNKHVNNNQVTATVSFLPAQCLDFILKNMFVKSGIRCYGSAPFFARTTILSTVIWNRQPVRIFRCNKASTVHEEPIEK